MHRRGGRGRYFDNFTFKVLEMGFEQCRYLKLGELGGTGGRRFSEKASISAKGYFSHNSKQENIILYEMRSQYCPCLPLSNF